MNSLINHNNELVWKIILSFFLGIFILSFSNEIFAAAPAANANDAIGNTLCNVVNNLSGNIARSIATIGIFVVGAGLFMGKLNWATGLATAVGIAIVFGAGKIVVWIGGSDAAACAAAAAGNNP